MIHPQYLIGMHYRLGADPFRHGKADCYSLAATVVNYYGFDATEPKREWYKRLRRGDTSVFLEELQLWGTRTTSPRIGVVALCKADNGYGMAAWWNDGWLNFAGSEVVWSPKDVPPVVACFFPQKQNSAMSLV